jgi:hypothetical protein
MDFDQYVDTIVPYASHCQTLFPILISKSELWAGPLAWEGSMKDAMSESCSCSTIAGETQ